MKPRSTPRPPPRQLRPQRSKAHVTTPPPASTRPQPDNGRSWRHFFGTSKSARTLALDLAVGVTVWGGFGWLVLAFIGVV